MKNRGCQQRPDALVQVARIADHGDKTVVDDHHRIQPFQRVLKGELECYIGRRKPKDDFKKVVY